MNGIFKAAAHLGFWCANVMFALWFVWMWGNGRLGAPGTLSWKVALATWCAMAVIFGAIGYLGRRKA